MCERDSRLLIPLTMWVQDGSGDGLWRWMDRFIVASDRLGFKTTVLIDLTLPRCVGALRKEVCLLLIC